MNSYRVAFTTSTGHHVDMIKAASMAAAKVWADKEGAGLGCIHVGVSYEGRARTTVDEWEIQGYYGVHGWEMLCTEDNRATARENLRLYRENEPGTSFRIVKKRVKIAQ